MKHKMKETKKKEKRSRAGDIDEDPKQSKPNRHVFCLCALFTSM